MKFNRLEIHQRLSFLEYIFGGCEIGLTIAIDFTASNGHPDRKDSLHNRDMENNEYLNAIRQVGQILQYYDTDKQIPVFGYGANYPPGSESVNHCFALNGDISKPEVNGLEGVIEVYKNAINTVKFSAPTKFAPILQRVNKMTEDLKCSQFNQKYTILLIITDGLIGDIQNTIDEIVYGSSLPLSIIIVGVGEADFSKMDQLDADHEPLYSNSLRK